MDFVEDPMGCDELMERSSGADTGRDSLDLHYPTQGVGEVYGGQSSFWDRRRLDYCRMPAVLGLLGATTRIGGVPRLPTRMSKNVPGWLQGWLGRPKLNIQESRSPGKATYILYEGSTFRATIVLKFDKELPDAVLRAHVEQRIPEVLKATSSEFSRKMHVFEVK